MPRLMSVALTEKQVRDRTKIVTRRLGWLMLEPGDTLTLCRSIPMPSPSGKATSVNLTRKQCLSPAGKLEAMKKAPAAMPRHRGARPAERSSMEQLSFDDVERDGTHRGDLLVHRLVMLAFVGLCPPGQEVLHGPGRELDNRLVNLKYGTHSENTLDKYRDGTDNGGENCYCAILRWEQVREIRRLRTEQHLLHRELAARFGVSETTIRKIVRGKTWREDRRVSQWSAELRDVSLCRA